MINVTAALMGDPPPERSALAQRSRPPRKPGMNIYAVDAHCRRDMALGLTLYVDAWSTAGFVRYGAPSPVRRKYGTYPSAYRPVAYRIVIRPRRPEPRGEVWL